MLNHLLKVRGIHVESQDKGIYYLTGDAIPIQLLLTRELTQEENFWLKNLRMDLITRANWTEMEVERKMCDALRELFAEELKEENERGMEQGMERGIYLAKLIFKLSAQGSSAEEIAEKCDLPLEQVWKILE